MDIPCNLQPCKTNFIDRKCMCYAEPGKTGIESARDQFCGFEAEDGNVYGCDPGCCGDGCPGQCKEVSPRPPERFIPSNSKAITDTPEDQKKPKRYMNIEIVLLVLVALSTFALLSDTFFFIARSNAVKSPKLYMVIQVIILLVFVGVILSPLVKGT